MTIEEFQIAKGFTSENFRRLDLQPYPSPDWDKAINAFKSRFESRFFLPLRSLAGRSNDSDQINGFIVLSCAFLLVETLGGFREGAASHNRRSKELFLRGLEGIQVEDNSGNLSQMSDDQKNRLYRSGRCALLHSAGTEKIRVRSSGPAIKSTQFGGFEVNRDEFLNWIKREFDRYADELKKSENSHLRENFRKKMSHIASS